jgi:hypothetical protein
MKASTSKTRAYNQAADSACGKPLHLFSESLLFRVTAYLDSGGDAFRTEPVETSSQLLEFPARAPAIASPIPPAISTALTIGDISSL